MVYFHFDGQDADLTCVNWHVCTHLFVGFCPSPYTLNSLPPFCNSKPLITTNSSLPRIIHLFYAINCNYVKLHLNSSSLYPISHFNLFSSLFPLTFVLCCYTARNHVFPNQKKKSSAKVYRDIGKSFPNFFFVRKGLCPKLHADKKNQNVEIYPDVF